MHDCGMDGRIASRTPDLRRECGICVVPTGFVILSRAKDLVDAGFVILNAAKNLNPAVTPCVSKRRSRAQLGL